MKGPKLPISKGKSCCDCKEVLPLSSFTRDRKAKDGLLYRCRECNRLHAAAYRAANQDAARKAARKSYNKHKHKYRQRSKEYSLMYNYGLTPEAYEKLLKDSLYMCRICGTPDDLVVDHCHTSGKVRGILCRACNAALGAFSDSIDTLHHAINYLKETK